MAATRRRRTTKPATTRGGTRTTRGTTAAATPAATPAATTTGVPAAGAEAAPPGKSTWKNVISSLRENSGAALGVAAGVGLARTGLVKLSTGASVGALIGFYGKEILDVGNKLREFFKDNKEQENSSHKAQEIKILDSSEKTLEELKNLNEVLSSQIKDMKNSHEKKEQERELKHHQNELEKLEKMIEKLRKEKKQLRKASETEADDEDEDEDDDDEDDDDVVHAKKKSHSSSLRKKYNEAKEELARLKRRTSIQHHPIVADFAPVELETHFKMDNHAVSELEKTITDPLLELAQNAEKSVQSLKTHIEKNNPTFLKNKNFWDRLIEYDVRLKHDEEKFRDHAKRLGKASTHVEKIKEKFDNAREFLQRLISHILRSVASRDMDVSTTQPIAVSSGVLKPISPPKNKPAAVPGVAVVRANAVPQQQLVALANAPYYVRPPNKYSKAWFDERGMPYPEKYSKEWFDVRGLPYPPPDKRHYITH